MNDDDVKLISANQARLLTVKKERQKDFNYSLTLSRLMKIIEFTAKQGNSSITFETPSFVLDGSLCDPILLARQLKARLIQLGYQVERNVNKLKISWEEEEERKKKQ